MHRTIVPKDLRLACQAITENRKGLCFHGNRHTDLQEQSQMTQKHCSIVGVLGQHQKENTTMNPNNANIFAIVQTKDLEKLATARATAAATLVYMSLMSFARDKVCCFPSIDTLSRSLGNAYSKRTIYRALEWLQIQGFIKRQDKRSKERFTIVSRLVDRTKKVLEKLCKPKKPYEVKPDRPRIPLTNQTPERNTKKNNSFKKVSSSLPSWRTYGNYERWETPEERTKSNAQNAWAELCLQCHPPVLSKASKDQKKAIINGIRTGELSWVLEVYPDILVET